MKSQSDNEGRRHLTAEVIGGIFVVIAACIGGVFLLINTFVEKDIIVVGIGNSSSSPTATAFQFQEPTFTNLPQVMHTSTVELSASDNDLSICSSFENGETRQVPSGTFVIGDIIIDGIRQYDEGGTVESTVAYFEKESTVLAQWGAGCKIGSKALANRVIKEQFEEGYTSVRFILVQSDGQQIVQYYNNQESTSTCPSTSRHLGAGKGFSVALQKGCHYHFNLACSGCSANVENNYIIYYTGESGDMLSVTVPEGSVWLYDRVPTTGEVCEAQDFYPTELPTFLSLSGVQLLRICG